MSDHVRGHVGGPTRATVLVVDDEPLIRMLIGRWLTSAGFGFVDAPSARDAVEILGDATRSIDLLVTDLAMPNMDGRQLIAWTRRARPELAILCMTGHAEGLPPGLPVLDKPFRAPQFLEAVRTALGGEVARAASAGA